MRRRLRRLLVIACALAVLVMLILPVAPVFATNPEVTMTVSAGVINITNTQATWALGVATESEVIYFSASGSQDDDYSTITNTGTLSVDIEIQGTDFEGGSYDWTLASVNGTEQYCLYANSGNGSSTYDIEVKSSAYNDLKTDLGAGATYLWSAKFTAPDQFNASDDGSQKSATMTLVASEH